MLANRNDVREQNQPGVKEADKNKSNKPLRGKSAPQYVAEGTVLNGRYRVEKMIGGGGFGQIYRSIDTANSGVVAVKVEPFSADSARMVLEQMVLVGLRGTKHAPLLYSSGTLGELNFIVMELLGRNLTEIRKKQRSKRISPGSVALIGVHMTTALHALHDLGYLHRDVKPSNMCVGVGDSRNTVFLVDFGMTRHFRTSKGAFRRERVYAAFRGTMRYVSITVHERKEQGPVDDLWSLYYTLIELGESQLPWRLVVEHDEIFKQKKKHSFEDMTKYTPTVLREWVDHLEKLRYCDMPDYGLLISVCKRFVSHYAVDSDFDFDDAIESL